MTSQKETYIISGEDSISNNYFAATSVNAALLLLNNIERKIILKKQYQNS